jgi:hypothetical protein
MANYYESNGTVNENSLFDILQMLIIGEKTITPTGGLVLLSEKVMENIFPKSTDLSFLTVFHLRKIHLVHCLCRFFFLFF